MSRPRWTRGSLLVAAPSLTDPNFDRTVVCMLEHTEEGALGVVLNRPSDILVADGVPDWAPYASEPAVVYIGGPVEPATALCVARGRVLAEGWRPLFADVGLVDIALGDTALHELSAVRLFAGYSGWAPAQLEAELAEGAWYVLDLEIDDLFTNSPSTLWRRVLARQPAPLSFVAQYPDDVTAN